MSKAPIWARMSRADTRRAASTRASGPRKKIQGRPAFKRGRGFCGGGGKKTVRLVMQVEAGPRTHNTGPGLSSDAPWIFRAEGSAGQLAKSARRSRTALIDWASRATPVEIVQIRWQRGARERRKPNPGSRLVAARGLNPVIFSSPASAAQQHQLHAPPCLILCPSARVGLAAAWCGSTRVSSQTPVDAACPLVRWRSHRVCGPGPCRCSPSPDVGVSAQLAPPPPLEAAQEPTALCRSQQAQSDFSYKYRPPSRRNSPFQSSSISSLQESAQQLNNTSPLPPPTTLHFYQYVRTRKGRQGSRQGWCQASPQGKSSHGIGASLIVSTIALTLARTCCTCSLLLDLARQHPGYHQARYPPSRASWWCQAYLGSDLRRDPRCSQALPRVGHPRLGHLH